MGQANLGITQAWPTIGCTSDVFICLFTVLIVKLASLDLSKLKNQPNPTLLAQTCICSLQMGCTWAEVQAYGLDLGNIRAKMRQQSFRPAQPNP